MNWKSWLQKGQENLRDLLHKPEQATVWVKHLPSPLADRLLSYASEVLEPSFWGSGLRMKELGPYRIWLELPYRRKQSLGSGELQIGALLSVGEWAFRLLWAQHFHLVPQRIWLSQGRVETTHPLTEGLWVRGELGVGDLERIQLELQKKGEHREEWSLSVLNISERQVGRIHLELNWKSDRLLPGMTR